MPERRIIADTGPLVAFLVASDPRHDWAVEQFRSLPAPFRTCEPVLAETFHLLGKTAHGPDRFLELLTRGLLSVDFSVTNELRSLEQLMRKYRDLPMSLADACLVRMSEIHSTAAVLTLDGHFKIYRKNGRQTIPVIMPV